MNPLDFIGGLGLQTKLVVIGACMAIAFVMGWRVHGWQMDSASSSQVKIDIKANTKLNKQTGEIVKKRDAEEQSTRIVYRTIHERINNAPDTDNVCFTPESLSLWNQSIAGADLLRPKPSGKTGEDGAPEPGAGATSGEILHNQSVNTEICNTNSIKHNALIDKVESLDGKMCLCHQ